MQTTGKIGDTVVISGSGIYLISSVYFGEQAGNFSSTENGILATVPYGASWGYVSLVSEERGISGLSTEKFAIEPYITGIFPLSGLPSETLNIYGSSFVGTTDVYINNLGTLFTVNSNSHISSSIPNGNTNGTVKVMGASGLYSYSVNSFTPIAKITGLSVYSGVTGSQIDVLGVNFITDIMHQNMVGSNFYTVSFNGYTGDFERINDSYMTGFVPYLSTSGPVTILKSISHSYPSDATYNVLSSTPIYSLFFPSTGSQNTDCYIYGSSFEGLSYLSVSGYESNYENVINSGYILSSFNDVIFFRFPVGGVSEGRHIFKIICSGGALTGEGPYIKYPPTITGFSPNYVDQDDIFRISGENLYHDSDVLLNDNQIPLEIVGFSPNFEYLDVVLSQTALETNLVYVNNGQGLAHLAGLNFVFQPSISGVIPSTAFWGGLISVSGNGMQFVNQLVFDESSISFTSVSNTGILFRVPTGSFDSTIKLIGPESSAYSEILNIIPNLVAISGFSPVSGERRGILFVSGLYLDTTTGVTFQSSGLHSITTTEFLIDSSRSLAVTIPRGATSGRFIIENKSGQVYSAENLGIYLPPIITRLDYNSGTLYEQPMYIHGENFDSSTIVLFENALTNLIIADGGPGIYQEVHSDTLMSIYVPTTVGRGAFYASGHGELTPMSFEYVPKPYYQTNFNGYNPKVYPSGGAYVVFSPVYNPYEIDRSVIYMSGEDGIKNIIDGSGDMIINYDNMSVTPFGYATITGYINSEFIGSGRIGFKHINDVTGVKANGREGGAFIDIYTKHRGLIISGLPPLISGYIPSSGGFNHGFVISGNRFNRVTGVKFDNGISIIDLSGYYTVINSKIIRGTFPTGDFDAFYGNSTGTKFIVYTRFGTGIGPGVDYRGYTGFNFVMPPIVTNFSPRKLFLGGTGFFTGNGSFFNTFSAVSGSGVNIGKAYITDRFGGQEEVFITGQITNLVNRYPTTGYVVMPTGINFANQDVVLQIVTYGGTGEIPLQLVSRRQQREMDELEARALLFR